MKLKSILSECWTGYVQRGMKNKGGRQVPNCVPESVSEANASDVIKDLDKVKNDLLKKVDVLVAKKKKLYSDVDIESPMSADEKKLDKDIADLFSQINKLVLQKRSLKSESVNEGRSVKSVQKDLDKVLDNIQSALAQYKAHKGTDNEKKHIENLKKLQSLKVKLETELDSAVSGLYRDAELKIEEGTLTEKQFKGLNGIPDNKSLEKISDEQKLKIIKAPGNIIDFFVPKGKDRNFWQVISSGKINKSSTGNSVVLKGKGFLNSPVFGSIDDLIKGVNWKSMEERRRFNEGIVESKDIKWQDVEVGDAANVKSLNKTGVIIKTYGRKFHLKFSNGSTKTYDASELTFVKN